MNDFDNTEAKHEEEEELNHLVDVLGNELAQSSVRRHVLPELVVAEQRGYWAA